MGIIDNGRLMVIAMCWFCISTMRTCELDSMAEPHLEISQIDSRQDIMLTLALAHGCIGQLASHL